MLSYIYSSLFLQVLYSNLESLAVFELLIDQTQINHIIQVRASLSLEYKGKDYCIIEFIPYYLPSCIESDFREYEDPVFYAGQSRCVVT